MKKKGIINKMENNNTVTEFFEFINQECIFYSITVQQDGGIHVKWENMTHDDYTITPDMTNKIIIRVHKSKQKPYYFLDFFQYFEKRTYWKGFVMNYCFHYEIHQTETPEWFDADFYFNKNEKQQLTIHHINTKVFLILQDFFSGFM